MAQSHPGYNKTLARLKVYIVISIHNIEKVVALNMLIVNFPKYLINCTDCAFHEWLSQWEMVDTMFKNSVSAFWRELIL